MNPWSAALRTTLPGSLLLAALIFGPIFWGCTWPLGISILNLMMLSAALSWCLGMFIPGSTAILPRLLVAATTGLLMLGWLMALNACTVCDPVTDLFKPRLAHFSYLPGSVDFDRSLDAMLRTTGILGTTLVAVWLGRDPVWRRLLLGTMALTAANVSFLGCLQRWSAAGDIFWATGRHLDFFFATYRNVTNAGEYLNLALPLAGAAVLYAFLRKNAPLLRAIATTGWTLIATGAWICGSRLAPGMSLLGLALLVILTRRVVWHEQAATSLRVDRVMLVALLGVLIAMILGAGLGTTADRLHRLLEPGGAGTAVHRWQVDQICLLATRDGGLAGFGPGTFASIFPYYSSRVSGDLSGYWTFAHDDYAQTMVEWGWLGTAFWAIYFFGGMAMLSRNWRRGRWTTEDRLAGAGLLVALGLIAATALIDFPLQIASIQLDVAVLLGLAWSSARWRPPVPGRFPRAAEDRNFLAWAERSPNVFRSTVS